MLVLDHGAFGPRGIGIRHRLQRHRHRLDDHVVDRQLVGRHIALVGLLHRRRRIDLRAQRQQRIEFAVERQVEMRDGGLGLDQAARDGLAHIVMRDELVGAFLEQFQHLIVRHRLYWRGRSGGRSAGGRGLRGRRLGATTGNRRVDIGLYHPAMRAGAGDSWRDRARPPGPDGGPAESRGALADGGRSPPLWGRCPAGQRGARQNATQAGQRPPLSASPTSPPRGGRLAPRPALPSDNSPIGLTIGIDPRHGRADRDIHALLAGDDSAATPLAGASISIAALSVSISNSTSPFLTLAPSSANQREICPVAMSMSTLGRMTSVGIAQRTPFTRSRAAAMMSGTCGTVAFSSSGL